MFTYPKDFSLSNNFRFILLMQFILHLLTIIGKDNLSSIGVYVVINAISTFNEMISI